MTQLPWTPVIYLPADLTVRFGADVLTAADPGPWCQRKAAELLGPDAAPKQVNRLTRCLKAYAAHFRSERLPATAALVFWPDFTRIPPRGEAQVNIVGEDPATGPMTLSRGREICGPDERTFGETEMTRPRSPPARHCEYTATASSNRPSAAPASSRSWTGSSAPLLYTGRHDDHNVG